MGGISSTILVVKIVPHFKENASDMLTLVVLYLVFYRLFLKVSLVLFYFYLLRVFFVGRDFIFLYAFYCCICFNLVMVSIPILLMY